MSLTDLSGHPSTAGTARPAGTLHQGQPVRQAGAPLSEARAAMVLLHGRGAGADDILGLTKTFDADGFAYLAPEAARRTWYPQSFLAPISANEPWLSSALALVDGLLEQIAAAGIPPELTMLLGFSQGACLALEYATRRARRYGGVAGLSGGLIGQELNPDVYRGSFDGTPVFLGCSDVDPHIPAQRVRQSASLLTGLGAQVTMRLYPQMPHSVNDDELAVVRGMMKF
jgi:phospholipase/carboxylesterase